VSYSIIATCEAWLGGAGKIATQVLRDLTSRGLVVDLVSLDTPHLYSNVSGPTPSLHIPPPVTANAIEPDSLIPFRLAQTIVAVAQSRLASGLHVTIWGTYLLPYVAAAYLATDMLRQNGSEVRLIISPAGSDIWQLAPQLFDVSRYLLFSSAVDARLTYTRQFAEEIQAQFHSSAPIETIYPILDQQRFRPPSHVERAEARRGHNVGASDFVLCCHCNMRPIKRPHLVVQLAATFARRVPSIRCVLLMVGPHPPEIPKPAGEPPNLRVLWTGASGRVEHDLYASDVAVNWSAHDSFNASLMEAMAVGLPIVTTDVVGIGPEILASGAGKLFGEGCFEQAAAYLCDLAQHRQLREDISPAAARHAAHTFGAERLLPEYLRVLIGRPIVD
jgi:glycosyltransferase involved in cell wall biosynthesis